MNAIIHRDAQGLRATPCKPKLQINPSHIWKNKALYTKIESSIEWEVIFLVRRTHFLRPETDEVFGFQFHPAKKLGSSGYSIQFYRSNMGQDPDSIKSAGKILCNFNGAMILLSISTFFF